MKRVHWVLPVPTPYSDYLLRAVAADASIDLLVHYSTLTIPGYYHWKEPMREGFASRACKKFFRVDWGLLLTAVRERNALFLVAGWRDPTMVALLLTLIMTRGHFAILTDTPHAKPMGWRRIPLIRKPWLRLLFRKTSSVLATGLPAIESLRSMGCAPEKLVNFPFFVDLNTFAPPPRRARTGEVVFLSVGRLENGMKAWDIGLRALATAAARTQVPWNYRIAGEGPDRVALERLAEELGIADRVHFEGWLEAADTPGFFTSGDILLHPARLDSFPAVILEAMACGLLVIGSEVTGSIRDRIQHQVNGLVHRKDDAADMSDQIIFALEHPAEVDSMRKAARAKAEEWPVERAIEILKHQIGDRK